MKIVKARIPAGNTVLIQEVCLYTVEEAKAILFGLDWQFGGDIYDTKETNKRIGWIASCDDGTGIYVEVKK